jgi:chaperonin GroEL
MQSRLAKLAGGIAVICVGGVTEAEVKERKDRVDDALAATQAAVEEGIIAGGGAALLYATRALKDIKVSNDDQRRGVDIVKKAIEAPIRKIAENAGVDGSVIVGTVLMSDNTDMGYNAQTEEMVNMIEAGIIDPTKVVRIALESAASIAALIITTEVTIAESLIEETTTKK